MEQISVFPLAKTETKPTFRTEIKGESVKCLFDTGADMPVWCSGIDYLKYLFDGIKEIDGIFLLGGFGEGYSKVSVYEIQGFKLGSIYYKCLQLAVDDKARFSYDLILSNTMFSKMDYEFRNRDSDSPTLRITYDNEIYATGLKRYSKDKGIIERIYSFSED